MLSAYTHIMALSQAINDMQLASPIVSGKLTAKPEEKLSIENVETIFEIQKKCTRTKGYPGVFAYDFLKAIATTGVAPVSTTCLSIPVKRTGW